jgi:uncharacterized protein (DUF2062 family)
MTRWADIRRRGGRFLQQGATPHALAMSTTVGLLLGLFPVVGVTTFAMSVLTVRFSLNLPLMLGVSYLIYPFQLLLIIPFIRLGERIVGAPTLPLSFSSLKYGLLNDLPGTLSELGVANLHAVLAWLLVAFPTGFLLYHVLRPVFHRLAAAAGRK